MKSKLLLVIYLSVLAAECFANLTNNLTLQFFSKPSLMLVLIFYFVAVSRSLSKLKNLIIGALVFSWLGDVVLLLDKIHKNLFIFGLLSFLAAHIFYIFYFWQIRKYNLRETEKSLRPFAFIGVAVYSTILYLTLYEHLASLKVPVLIYSAVISLMLLASLHAFGSAKTNYDKICIFGTTLFVASDSILAVNRFVTPFALAPILIMLTYGFAQLLITLGSLRNLREIDENQKAQTK